MIASLVQIVEMAIKKLSPTLFRQLGIFLPLITTNCAILGLAIFQTNRDYDFVQGLFFAIGAGLGLTLALVLMASIREETELRRRAARRARHGARPDHRREPLPGLHGLRRIVELRMSSFVVVLLCARLPSWCSGC